MSSARDLDEVRRHQRYFNVWHIGGSFAGSAKSDGKGRDGGKAQGKSTGKSGKGGGKKGAGKAQGEEVQEIPEAQARGGVKESVGGADCVGHKVGACT